MAEDDSFVGAVLSAPRLVAFAVELNPEPWAIGPIDIKRNKATGKHYPQFAPEPTLEGYQNALKELLQQQGATMKLGFYAIRLHFSRQLAKYVRAEDSGTSNRHWADGTNMMKATEDALQGVVIGNDRDVIYGTWRMIGPQLLETDPYVIIEVAYGLQFGDGFEFPPKISDQALEAVELMHKRKKESENLTDLEWEP